ncbi:MAG: MFS transporter [Flavonifractor plautii]|nr:MFS transporter [Flavonifractor plautii]
MERPSPGRRKIWNITMFIISYALNNLVSGIIYDTYVNYMQEMARSVATSFWAFYGYATFISALMLLLIPKTGYKKLLVFCSASCAAALLSAVFMQTESVFFLTTLLALVGIQLHYIMLAPYVAVFTDQSNNIDWYTRAYYLGYLGYFLTTYLGGVLTVKMFSLRAGVTYQAAKTLTEHVDTMAPGLREHYLQGNRDVLLLVAVLALVGLIPVLLIREEREDHCIAISEQVPWRQRLREMRQALLQRDAVIYLIYWVLISFGMGLFTSYYSIFLNRNLHIDRATSSLLVSLSYLAIVLFLLFTPAVVRRFGQIVTLGGVAMLSVPFMLLIANGDRFGQFMVPVVGIALFMRSGLINLSSPVDSALSMELVPRQLRPAFASMINLAAGLASILSGWFTGNVLFVEQEGYRTAYYIASGIYVVACVLLMAGLWKYNRAAPNKEEGRS